MKTIKLMKTFFVVTLLFVAQLTVSSATRSNNLIYNAEEVNGVKVSETVYKMQDNILTNYMKYNYKYNDSKQMTENMSQKWNSSKNAWENHMCIRYIYENKSVITEYYKWNNKKNEFVLVPEMTVTMDK